MGCTIGRCKGHTLIQQVCPQTLKVDRWASHNPAYRSTWTANGGSLTTATTHGLPTMHMASSQPLQLRGYHGIQPPHCPCITVVAGTGHRTGRRTAVAESEPPTLPLHHLGCRHSPPHYPCITGCQHCPAHRPKRTTYLLQLFEAVPLNPMQLMKAAAQMSARECLQMFKLAVIMHFQEMLVHLSKPSPWVMPCSSQLPACTSSCA